MEGEVAEQERLQIANRVSFFTLCMNIGLAVLKVLAGIFAKSNAMLADGVHTISDVATTVAVMVGMRFSTKPEDAEHPYGHEKIEAMVAVLLAAILFLTACGIGYGGILALLSGNIAKPGAAALLAAAVSIVSKEAMYQYTVRAANKINSGALRADAWHHRSDALSSIGTLVGVGGARLGIPVLDPLASLVVCMFIMKVAFAIGMQGIDQLIDRAADLETIENIRKSIWSVEGVRDIDEIKTRLHGAKVYVDVEIAVDMDCTVGEGHAIAENVHHCIENSIDHVKHCMVHVNPFQENRN